MEGPLRIRIHASLCGLSLLSPLAAARQENADAAVRIRIATFDVGDVRTADLLKPDEPRLRGIAEILQRLRPNIVLLSGIAYDSPGGPDVKDGEPPGQNARRLVEKYLAVPQREGLKPLNYSAFFESVNRGTASGRDLNRDGQVVSKYPAPPGRAPDGSDLPWSAGVEAYAGDCWGYGAFPGQSGMVLLVDERLRIAAGNARTFRLFPWDYMAGAQGPWTGASAPSESPTESQRQAKAGEADRSVFRLSSTSHWDVPVELPNKAVVHLLCSHPAEPRGAKSPETNRNHDEIRFWADYVEELSYFVDDKNTPGGLPGDAPFIILGNLGSPPDVEDGPDPIGTTLLGARRVNGAIVPRSTGLEAPLDSATTVSGQRLDYVLPSRDLGIAAAGVWRLPPEGSLVGFPAAHFPVWMEIVVPARVPPPKAVPEEP